MRAAVKSVMTAITDRKCANYGSKTDNSQPQHVYSILTHLTVNATLDHDYFCIRNLNGDDIQKYQFSATSYAPPCKLSNL